MKKDKEWLKEEVNEIKKLISDAWGAAVIAGNRHFEIKNSSEMQIVKRISDLIDQLDEPEVTLDRAFEKVAESYYMTKEEVWRHLEWLEVHGGKVTFGESEVFAKKKPIIPQFVADHIEKYKGRGLLLGTWLDFIDLDEFERKTKEWVYSGNQEEKLKREYLLIDAIRYGYEVEKEKLYHVVNKENYFMLRKYDGLVDIMQVSSTMSRDEFGKDTRFMLTEQEIKSIDERYWAFAEEVTE